MVAVRDELRRGNLWVEGSRRYRQLADFFLPEPEWTARWADFFSRARLPAKAEDGGRFLARRLAAAYDRFQSRFPENAQVKVAEDGWRLSSDVAERRSPTATAAVRTEPSECADDIVLSLCQAGQQTDQPPDHTPNYLPQGPRMLSSVLSWESRCLDGGWLPEDGATGVETGRQSSARLRYRD